MAAYGMLQRRNGGLGEWPQWAATARGNGLRLFPMGSLTVTSDQGEAPVC
jgi:hypothetical protein